jgi:hypothetical protein
MLHVSDRFTRAASVVAIAGGLALGATGIAVAATGAGSVPPHQTVVPSPDPITPLPGQTQPGQDQGTGDYTPPGEQAEQPDPGEARHSSEAELANDSEPNHQDPNGNVDHTPAGEKPESPASATG